MPDDDAGLFSALQAAARGCQPNADYPRGRVARAVSDQILDQKRKSSQWRLHKLASTGLAESSAESLIQYGVERGIDPLGPLDSGSHQFRRHLPAPDRPSLADCVHPRKVVRQRGAPRAGRTLWSPSPPGRGPQERCVSGTAVMAPLHGRGRSRYCARNPTRRHPYWTADRANGVPSRKAAASVASVEGRCLALSWFGRCRMSTVQFSVSGEAYDRFMGRYSIPLAPFFANFAGANLGPAGSRCGMRARCVDSRARRACRTGGGSSGRPVGRLCQRASTTSSWRGSAPSSGRATPTRR